KLALYFKAELENVTDVGPSNEAYEWHFKFDNKSIKPYTNENSGQFSQMAIIECRGLEFVDFDPRTGFKAKGAESKTIFDDIDLTSKQDWAEYDEEAGVPVGISE
ncbi:27962_t:CDS:2, partial [Dentiscutata erythropus]